MQEEEHWKRVGCGPGALINCIHVRFRFKDTKETQSIYNAILDCYNTMNNSDYTAMSGNKAVEEMYVYADSIVRIFQSIMQLHTITEDGKEFILFMEAWIKISCLIAESLMKGTDEEKWNTIKLECMEALRVAEKYEALCAANPFIGIALRYIAMKKNAAARSGASIS